MPQEKEQTISYYSSSYTGKEIDNAVANVEINASNIKANKQRITNHETTFQTVKKELENRYTKDEADNKFISAERFYTKDEIDEINNNFSLQKDTYTKQEVIDKLRALYKSLYITLYNDVLQTVDQTIKEYHNRHGLSHYLLNPDVPLDFVWKDNDYWIDDDNNNQQTGEFKPL